MHVDAKLYGLKLDDTSYGAADITSDFTIGRNQVVVADVNSHDLVVKQDGVDGRHLPRLLRPRRRQRRPEPGHPLRHPRGDREGPEYLMNNPRYGYTNILQHWAVRISNNGEFIHANPDSAGAQGNSNVTHGCVNLSLADAEAYFNSAI